MKNIMNDNQRENAIIILLIAWITSMVVLIGGFAWYVSFSAERRCIIGAEKAGDTREEIKNWCRNTF